MPHLTIKKAINFYSRSFDSLGTPCQSWQNSLKWPFSKKSKKNTKKFFYPSAASQFVQNYIKFDKNNKNKNKNKNWPFTELKCPKMTKNRFLGNFGKKKFFYENTNSNMVSDSVSNLRKKFHANRM